MAEKKELGIGLQSSTRDNRKEGKETTKSRQLGGHIGGNGHKMRCKPVT